MSVKLPRSPMDLMLDAVDWKCTVCGTSAKIGCDCHEKRKAAFIEREYKRLMKLSDADLLRVCADLGVDVEGRS